MDEDEDLLAKVYNQVLRFVERDLKRIMELAEKVSSKVVRTEKALKSPKKLTENEPLNDSEEREGYEIMANVVWAEFGRAIMDEMGGVVFAAGKPDEFRKAGIYLLFIISYTYSETSHSTMKRHRHLYVRWSSWHRLFIPSKPCVRTPSTPLSRGDGNCLFIFSYGGRKSSASSRML